MLLLAFEPVLLHHHALELVPDVHRLGRDLVAASLCAREPLRLVRELTAVDLLLELLVLNAHALELACAEHALLGGGAQHVEDG
eukprot:934840-Rhodomonas_salina.1